ncbi:MAG: hypothetical protein Q8J98_05550 [Phaeovulum sp.]|uniref:hypothetical protein n=2 Tax=Phaeovulum sp. TaxID=2934796 RepID=UPI00272F0F3E|nr:hypothetical protein [Phaeovulum sp.]MDP2062555.1 hypothetical protein [Phaeovulum sp.]
MKTMAVAALAVLAGSGAAFSQGVGSSPVYANGMIQYEYLGQGGDWVDFGYGDLALGLRGNLGNKTVGLELGVVAIGSSEGSFSRSALFPTVWVETSFGKFSAGVPRSAMASRIKVPTIAGTYYFTDFYQLAFNFTDMALLQGGVDSYGVRYDGAFGGFDVGLSAHHLSSGSGSGTSITGFVGRDYGALDFAVGFEHLQGDSSSETTYTATLGYDVGLYGARLTLGDSFMMADSAYSLEAFYRPLDWLKVKASYGNYAGSSIYGVNAEASFLKNGYVGVGYFDSPDFGEGFATAYAGWKLNY